MELSPLELAIKEMQESPTFKRIEMGGLILDRVLKFMHDNRVYCEETIYQTDGFEDHALELVEDLYHIVEPLLPAPDADE
jgi:hypothetical protein